LDDDDLFPTWTLARHAEALSRDRAADFSYGRYVRFRGKAPPSPSDLWDEEFVPTRDPRRLVVKLMERCFLPNPAWAVRREAQRRVGSYDESMVRSQDYAMILRLARTNEGAFVDERVLYQRTHPGLRGPALDRSEADRAVHKWIKYDALFFHAIDRDWRPEDFRPFLDEASEGDEALALLQKGIILFQRKVYDGARRALHQYRRAIDGRIPGRAERRIAAGLLGCRYGIADLADCAAAGGEAAAWMRAMRWPFSMRLAFATQLRWRVRAALYAGETKFAGQLLRQSRDMFGVAVTLAVMGSKYNAGANRWRAQR
jgi:hypothetical protein